ncbi:antirestriction protein [Halomonas sp. 3A7M]|uniref:antirestriction protein n=1 Tax=Halomonas sp. 3A7M TaxID=2742616 RepID=UPI0018682894|nr:antirestriction protein [Halomonas sp. 3A7M]
MQPTTKITASIVPKAQRSTLLPKPLELEIQHAMRMICEDYQGGSWEFYELSDRQAAYIAPGRDELLSIKVAGAFYEGSMTADAAGITATLIALNKLANTTRLSRFANQYHALRMFACTHPEQHKILIAAA